MTASDTTTPAKGSESATGRASPIDVTGLTNGDSYTFRVTAANALGTGPPSGPSNAVVPSKVTNDLAGGHQLRPGQDIMSPNGYKVVMQRDGNLVEYASDGRPLWASHTYNHPGAYAAMQQDGNLVVYLADRPLWATDTGGQGPSHAVIQRDANFVVYTDSGRATWACRGGRIS